MSKLQTRIVQKENGRYSVYVRIFGNWNLWDETSYNKEQAILQCKYAKRHIENKVNAMV